MAATATNAKFYVDGVETTWRDDQWRRHPHVRHHRGVHRAATTSPPRCFDGALDDVRIYNRVLTLAEIQAIHRAGL